VIQIEEALESCVCPEPGAAMALVRDRNDIDSIGIDLLLEGIRRRWGYDFTHYSYASMRRRLEHARRFRCRVAILFEDVPAAKDDVVEAG